MLSDADLFKQYLDDKTSFYKTYKNGYGYRRRYGYGGNNTQTQPPALIVKLSMVGHNFTQEEFNKFITCVTYNKGNSFIVNNRPSYHSPIENRKEAIAIMFTKFNPSEKQFDMLVSCYKTGEADMYWVDVLKKKNFAFTDKQKKQLVTIGYDSSIVYQGQTNLTVADVKEIIASIFKGNTGTGIIKDVVEQLNIQYPENFLDQVISLCANRKSLDIPLTKIIEFLMEKKGLKINDTINDTLINNKFCAEMIEYMLDKGLRPNSKLIDFCATSKKRKLLILIMHKTHKIELTTDLMNKMIQSDVIFSTNDYGNISKIYNRLLKIGYKYYKSITNSPLNLTQFMIDYDIKVDQETFKIACKKHYENLFDHCVSKCKMMPTEEHLTLALQEVTLGNNIELINKLLFYKIPINSHHFELAAKYSSIVLELLIKFGYEFIKTDIKYMLKYGNYLDELDRFNIKLDEEVYYWSHIYNNWYYEDQIQLADKTIQALRKLCSDEKTTPEQFAKFLQENNIQPDGYCLERAACSNDTLVKHMLETLKYIPTMSTFYWLNIEHSESYYTMVQHYKIDDTYLSAPLKVAS